MSDRQREFLRDVVLYLSGFVIIILIAASMSGCASVRRMIDPDRCNGTGFLTHMDCV